MKHKGLNQLLCAAVVNDGFCKTLLRNPAQALASGYYDHTFSLTPEERDLVVDIRAKKLEDFAAQVYNWISGNGKGRSERHGRSYSGHNGYGHKAYNGHNGNGQNGNGKHNPLGSRERFLELHSAPVPA
jgi:hypothetical protein